MTSPPLRLVRLISALVVVLALVALAVLALHTSHTTVRSIVSAARQHPIGTTSAPATPTASSSAAPSPSAPPLVTAPVVAITAATTPSGGPTPTAPATPTTPVDSGIPQQAAATCPVGLPAPAVNGGLQSLITLAPIFGQFSSEAFAPAAAYAPLLQLVGPILAQYPSLAPSLAPLLTPIVTYGSEFSNALFELIDPYYAPYREQVINDEIALAAVFAPYAQKLATSPLAACVVDVEGLLVRSTA